MPFVYGALGGRGAATFPLLTFAHPLTNDVTQHGSLSFHMTVVYDAKIVPSSFVVTLNGRNVDGLFHHKQSTIETVAIPVTPGSNVIRLTVGATSPSMSKGTLRLIRSRFMSSRFASSQHQTRVFFRDYTLAESRVLARRLRWSSHGYSDVMRGRPH